jgi:hypothetical protein
MVVAVAVLGVILGREVMVTLLVQEAVAVEVVQATLGLIGVRLVAVLDF